jgi:MinD-like ATPase involved in chromosome partitioning or flagellar assembly
MSVTAFGAVRSSGVTTLSLALASTWPQRRRVLLAEFDPAGGTLAATAGWPPQPGLVSLAAAARRCSDPHIVWEHCQQLPGGAPVLAGPASADQAHTALAMLTGMTGHLSELGADVLLDCGRVVGASPSEAMLQADRVILVARPRVSDLQAVATWLESHPLDGANVRLVLVGRGSYPDAEVAEAIGVEVLGRLPWDADAVENLVVVPASARELKTSPLVRAARTMAEALCSQVERNAHLDPEAAGFGKPALTRGSRIRRPRWAKPVGPQGSVATTGNAPEEVNH